MPELLSARLFFFFWGGSSKKTKNTKQHNPEGEMKGDDLPELLSATSLIVLVLPLIFRWCFLVPPMAISEQRGATESKFDSRNQSANAGMPRLRGNRKQTKRTKKPILRGSERRLSA